MNPASELSPIINTRGTGGVLGGTGWVAVTGAPVNQPWRSTTRSVLRLAKYATPRSLAGVIARLAVVAPRWAVFTVDVPGWGVPAG